MHCHGEARVAQDRVSDELAFAAHPENVLAQRGPPLQVFALLIRVDVRVVQESQHELDDVGMLLARQRL